MRRMVVRRTMRMAATMIVSMLLMTVVMAVLDSNYDCGNADGDCDGADEVEGCIEDDEDNGDNVHFLLMLFLLMLPLHLAGSRWIYEAARIAVFTDDPTAFGWKPDIRSSKHCT